MAKVIKQFRYYEDNNPKNYPTTITRDRMRKGQESNSIFFEDDSLLSIVQLGIQTLPGTKFYLNKSDDPIIIGSTGIYELDLNGYSEITSLSFNFDSLKIINQVTNSSLIVDAIYEAEDKEE